MPARLLSEYLERYAVDYHCYNHPPAVTALEVAQSAHIPGHRLAKTVICWADDTLVMAVIPADEQLDVDRLRAAIGVYQVRVADESEFDHRFPDCESGGQPPLGNLYQMRVYMDPELANGDWIAFNAGSHTEVIKMDADQYLQLVKPVLCGITRLH